MIDRAPEDKHNVHKNVIKLKPYDLDQKVRTLQNKCFHTKKLISFVEFLDMSEKNFSSSKAQKSGNKSLNQICSGQAS